MRPPNMEGAALQTPFRVADPMHITLADSDGAGRLILEGSLDIAHASTAKPPMLAAIAAHAELEMDLSLVEALDAAGLQLLILCKNEASRIGHRIQLIEHSPAVLGTLDLFNLAAFFGDPLVLPPKHDKPGPGRAS